MIDHNNYFGFREVANTADVALQVRGKDITDLFIQAALGMYALMRIEFGSKGFIIQRKVVNKEWDIESLLVSFLSELIFYAGRKEGFNQFNIAIRNNRLVGKLVGRRIVSMEEEVKAVTFHNLEINKCKRGYEVLIVFDV